MIAAATVPPTSRIDAAANCADPANVVIDITIGASVPMPAALASTPKETPNPTTAIAKRGDRAHAVAVGTLLAGRVAHRRGHARGVRITSTFEPCPPMPCGGPCADCPRPTATPCT